LQKGKIPRAADGQDHQQQALYMFSSTDLLLVVVVVEQHFVVQKIFSKKGKNDK